jgi:hypothetical protein
MMLLESIAPDAGDQVPLCRRYVQGARLSTTETVYVASSCTLFATAHYDRYLTWVRAAYPGARVLSARDLLVTDDDWVSYWPQPLRAITALVFFCDGVGCIPRRVFDEIADTARAGIPVRLLTDDGGLHDGATVEFFGFDERCWARYCRVRPGVVPTAGGPTDG